MEQIDNTIINNIPVSELQDVTDIGRGILSSDTLFLISQKGENGKYLSEKVNYDVFKRNISSSLDMEGIHIVDTKLSLDINDICSLISDLTLSDYLTIESQPPYIISSWLTHKGRQTDIQVYRLSSGMDYEFKHKIFDTADFNTLKVRQCDSEPTANSNSVLNSGTLKNTMNKYFMDGYSDDNQLTHKDFVNSSINNVAAYYVTKQNSEPIRTFNELTTMTKDDFWSGRDKRCPTRNDYCFVLSDETHKDPSYPDVHCTSRYVYNGLSSGDVYKPSNWTYQYTVNNTPFNDAQWKAVNSGIRNTNKVVIDDSKGRVGVGSQTIPIYVDNSGIVHQITSYSGTADNAISDNHGNDIYETYLNKKNGGTVEGDVIFEKTVNLCSNVYIGGKTISSVMSGDYLSRSGGTVSGDVDFYGTVNLCGDSNVNRISAMYEYDEDKVQLSNTTIIISDKDGKSYNIPYSVMIQKILQDIKFDGDVLGV